MPGMTITEALAELKTLKVRIGKRREAILPYLVRPALMRDPMEKEGGVAEWIKRERQAIGDMEQRYVSIRTSVQRKNLDSTLALKGKERTVADWLTWRREISDGQTGFLTMVARQLASVRSNPQYQGRGLKPENEAGDKDIIVHVSEADIAAEADSLTELLGELDGRLSLANATLTIEV